MMIVGSDTLPDGVAGSPPELLTHGDVAVQYSEGSVFVGEIRLPGDLPDPPPAGVVEARYLVRFHLRPVGWISIQASPSAAEVRKRIAAAVRDSIGDQLLRAYARHHVLDGPDETPRSPISVIVCTRDRTDQLRRCLDSLLRLEYQEVEIIVVDNAPSTDDTFKLISKLPVRYVREDRPGLDRARNRGIREASHEILAFTDDDVVVDEYWLRAVDEAFRDPDVAAVTGLVAPYELRSPVQVFFEDVYGGMQKGLQPRYVRREGCSSASLLWASAFGVGANMSFRRSLFSTHDLFDPALDVGTPSGGGGDIEMLHRLVAEGRMLKYDPNVLVWHQHRATEAALRKQIRANARSFGSYLLTCARRKTVSRRTIAWFALRHWIGGWIFPRLLFPRAYRRSLVWQEFLGMLESSFAYRASQRFARNSVKS